MQYARILPTRRTDRRALVALIAALALVAGCWYARPHHSPVSHGATVTADDGDPGDGSDAGRSSWGRS